MTEQDVNDIKDVLVHLNRFEFLFGLIKRMLVENASKDVVKDIRAVCIALAEIEKELESYLTALIKSVDD